MRSCRVNLCRLENIVCSFQKKMLSKEETLVYIRDDLGIKEPEAGMKRNRLEFLNKLLCAFYAAMPFQNVTHISKPLSERHVPSIAEIKQSLLSGGGGLCFTSNLSLFMMLQSMGFEVYLNLSNVDPEKNDKDDHVILLIKNLEAEGDMYIVDGGFGHPFFHAISLDFGEESPAYHESYLCYKFVKTGEKIRLMIDRSILLLSHDTSSGVPKSGEFVPSYDFRINPTKDIENLIMHMDTVYLDPEQTPFHKSIRALRFRNKKLVLISNCKLVLEADDGKINIDILTDDEAIVAAFKEHFPEFDESCVREALKNWRNL